MSTQALRLRRLDRKARDKNHTRRRQMIADRATLEQNRADQVCCLFLPLLIVVF